MSTKIIGATVGTPIKPSRIGKELKPVKTVNGVFPDKNGDVAVQAGSGIHVGAEPPTDENIQVWVDTDEEAEGGVTSWNDLKDKPFGEERTEQVIVGGELEPMEGDWYRFRLQDKAAVAGYLGMQLALTINDTRYDAIFNDDESASDYVCTIPDVARVDADQFGGAWIWTVYTMEPGYVSVAVVNETIKTIDPKYIPSGIGEGADIDVVATPGQMIVVKSVDENGKPTEWEAIDIPEGGAQADAVQADMAQSDSSKPDYIKNRTHWKETKLTNATEIIAETTITGARKNFTGVTLEAGKTYAVTYNGETYIRKAAAYSTAVYIGDVSIIIGTAHSTGEPFCLWYNGEYVVLNRRDNAAATISVTEGTAEEVYHQLDRRYIKDMYGDDFAEILPECQLTPMEDGGGFVVFDPLPTDLQPGETYTINWNGAAYECVALPYEEEGVQMGVMLGNAGALTGEGDSNEPFFMAVLSSEYAAAMGIGLIAYALDGSLAPTLSIMGAGGVVKIPEKYLPNCVVKTVNGISPDENGNVEVVGGGSGGGMETLVDLTLTEPVNRIDLFDTTLENFPYRELWVYTYCPAVPDGEALLYIVAAGGYSDCGGAISSTTDRHFVGVYRRTNGVNFAGLQNSNKYGNNAHALTSNPRWFLNGSWYMVSNNSYPLPVGLRVLIQGRK